MSQSQSQSNAYIIEIQDRAAGIVTRDARGFRFFSSERVFDSLEGRQFRSAREAERAARAVLSERGRLSCLAPASGDVSPQRSR